MSDSDTSQFENLLSLKNALLFEEMTTFAQLGNYGLFVPKSANFSSTFLNWRPHQIIDPRDFILRRDSGALLSKWKPSKDPNQKKSDCRVYLNVIFQELKKKKLKFGLLDVGGYLGVYSVLAGLLAKKNNLEMPIKCFEPGPTDNFIEANSIINLIPNFELRRVAISDVVGPMLYKYSAGNSIIGGIHRMENELSRIVYSSTIEDEITGKFSGLDCVIAKIDVEGFEPEALAGMGSQSKNVPIIICEVQPWAENKMIGEQTYIEMLEKDYYIVEIGNSIWPHNYEGIKNDGVAKYFNEIRSRKPPVSDMIMLRKDFKLGKTLYQKLCKIDTMDRRGIND